jgi:hypothetical protein
VLRRYLFEQIAERAWTVGDVYGKLVEYLLPQLRDLAWRHALHGTWL